MPWISLLSFFAFGSRCWGCSRALLRHRDFCFACRKHLLADVKAGRGLLKFGDPAKGLVSCLRGRAMFLGARWAVALAERKGRLAEWEGQRIDLVTWAPRARPRREDGLPLLARAIAERIGAEARPLFLKERRHSQHDQDRSGRMNVDAFVIWATGEEAIVRGRRVLVIDDVDTTGTTLEIAAYRLRKAGAAEVSLFSVATQVMERFERERREPEEESEEVHPLLLHLFV